MPHFIIHCTEKIANQKPVKEVLHAIHDTAVATGLFATADIKVRIQSFKDYITAGTDADFVHVFAYIMEGRTVEQKANLYEGHC